MNAASDPQPGEEPGSPYLGWLVGTVMIVVVLAIGAGLWISFHGL